MQTNVAVLLVGYTMYQFDIESWDIKQYFYYRVED